MNEIIVKIIASVIFLMQTFSISAQPVDNSETKLKIGVTAEKQCYEPNQNATVDIRITNLSDSLILLYNKKGQNFIPGLRWSILDENNQIVYPRDTYSRRFVRKVDIKRFVRILPNTTIGQEIQFSLKSILSNKIGIYHFYAYYESPVSISAFQTREERNFVWTSSDDNISSPIVAFSIKENCEQ